jgi:hypothetical protein
MIRLEDFLIIIFYSQIINFILIIILIIIKCH